MTRPPGALLLAAGYGAGLATGLSRLTGPMFGSLLLLSVITVAWRRSWWPLVPAFIAGAIVGGHARIAAAGWCAATLPLGEARYQIRSIDPGEGTGRVLITGRGCSGAVMARWPRGALVPAGQVMAATARWTVVDRPFHHPDGLLLIGATDSVRGMPSPIERARTAIARATRELYGPRAPLANALLAGWRGELDPDLRRAFASAGLMHLLAISGLHVACLAGWVFLLLRLGRTPRHVAECAGALAALMYAAFLGWPPAALRAALLLLLVAGCRWRQREVSFSALLGVSLLGVLLFDPWGIAEPGAWLTIAGVSGVTAALRWSNRVLKSAWWIRSVAASTGAVVATAPIAAGVFGQVAPVGVVLNIVGLPLLLVLLPALFASVLLAPVAPWLAAGFAASGNGLLALIELLARLGSQAPGSAAAGPAGWGAAWPWVAVLLAASWAIRGGTTLPEAFRRVAWSVMTALVLLTAFGGRHTGPVGDHQLTLLFLDVGQGDAALLRTPAGHWIEVDAGPAGEGRDAGRRVIAPLLARRGVRRIDVFVLSHAHRDHVGGGASLLGQVPVDLAIEPGELFADSSYEDWLATLAVHHSRWRAVSAGAHWTLDGVGFRVLHPPVPWPRQGEDLNEDSIVLEVTFGDFRALLMGDAGFVAESAMAAGLPVVNVLKVGHHGSRTASGEAFLAAIQPQAAIVSVGRNNYGHPAPETLDRLSRAGATVWRTDVDGNVAVTTDGQTLTVSGARSVATFPARH